MPENEKHVSPVIDEKEFGIDLGSSNTVIYQRKKGIVLREPSVIAIDTRTDEVVACGRDAQDMVGKTPENIIVIKPVANGAVADLPACAAMIKYFMHKILKGVSIRKPRVIISVPASLTDVERRAVEDAAKQAGISSVSLFEAPMAAALGADLPVGAAKGSFILNIGAGVSEAAVIALGDIVSSAGSKVGSSDIDTALISYMRKQYGLIIGRKAAEELKIKIGSAYHTSENSFAEVRGRSAVDGLPRSYSIQADEIRGIIQPVVVRISELIAKCLEDAPAELAGDIFDSGIVLTGSGSELSGLADFISEYIGVKVVIPERMRDCVAEGTGKSLDLVVSDRGVRRFRRNTI